MILSISLSQIEKRQKKILFIDFPQFPKVTSCDIAKSFFFACALKSLSSSFLYALLNSDFINLKKGIGVYHVSFLPFLWFALLLMMKSRFWRFLTTILFSLHTSLIIIRESQLGHHTVLKSLIFVQKFNFDNSSILDPDFGTLLTPIWKKPNTFWPIFEFSYNWIFWPKIEIWNSVNPLLLPNIAVWKHTRMSMTEWYVCLCHVK